MVIVWRRRGIGRLAGEEGVDVREVRRWVRGQLGRLAVDGVDLDDVDLMVDEIAANALRHTRSGSAGGGVWAEAMTAPDRIRVEITDDGGASSVPAAGVAVDSGAECGRGLAMVAALADEWGFAVGTGDRRPVTVWFEVVRTEAG